MNKMPSEIFIKANYAAVYNIYLYLANKTTPDDGETLLSIVEALERNSQKRKIRKWKNRDMNRLIILKNAVAHSRLIAQSKIGNLTRSQRGLTACSFTTPNKDVFVVFKGTGSGEWIDNGEGLSGIPEENTYLVYENGAELPYSKIIKNDCATDQQVEALNWFNGISIQNGWNEDTKIIVSGHSKGGNKAQFIAMNSDLPDGCYSFNGHGFSPEAIELIRTRSKLNFEKRRQKIISLSSDNDYVNVLGRRLMPASNIYYFKSSNGLHYMESLLDGDGNLNQQCEQGKLSLYIEKMCEEIMNLKPDVRKYATLGIMNIFQKYFGKETPVNGDTVSVEETITGIGVALVPFLRNFIL